MRTQNLPKMVTRAMTERRMTAYRLAKLVGCSRTTVINFTSGERAIGSDTLVKILAVLDLTVTNKGKD